MRATWHQLSLPGKALVIALTIIVIWILLWLFFVVLATGSGSGDVGPILPTVGK